MWLRMSALFHTTCRGVLTGLYPHCCNSTTSVVSESEYIALAGGSFKSTSWVGYKCSYSPLEVFMLRLHDGE